MLEINEKYKNRAAHFETTSIKLRDRYNLYSIFRLLIFFAAAFIALFLFFQWGVLAGGLFVVLFLFGFSRFIKWHKSVLQAAVHHRYLSDINKAELKVLNHEFSHFDSGKEFVDPQHPYLVDLDIFGEHSLFQYCNRTATALGKKQLAAFFSQLPRDRAEILHRQEAVKELKDKLDWRQHFQAFGMAMNDDADHVRLLKLWLSDTPFVLPNLWLKWALLLVPLWTITGLIFSAYHGSWALALFFLLLPGVILMKTTERVNKAHQRTTHAENILSFYARLIRHIENEECGTSRLSLLRKRFFDGDQQASDQIRQLSYIIGQLNVRYNAFAILFNLIGLWDLFWVLRLEKWRAKNKEKLPDWFTSLALYEAYISLATLCYNQPDWVFPILDDREEIVGKMVGHPLIFHRKRVCNDFISPTKAHIKLITGSNMAGKSTFLRTVGINIILAMTGSVVCAKSIRMPLLAVFSSMRTQDALHESTSSFYAELKRLKLIIEAVENNENIYFLLDEILKGTNSRDRHTGSRALIKQLIKSGGGGIIATHDLELGNLEETSKGAIENLCMEVAVEDGALNFDYRLKKGVSKSFNATILMKEMGIKIN